MSRKLLSVAAAATLAGNSAFADVPNVAVDIAPLHSLVTRVMQGVGTPDLIVQPGATPHEYSLRPSQARAVQNAELVFWIGEDLTPWLEGALETLAAEALVTAFLDRDETDVLAFREGTLFEAHEHNTDHNHSDHVKDKEHGHDHDHAHGHDYDHAHGHDHDHAHGHDHEHAHGHDDHAGHDHGARDPHAWLSTGNARAWLDVIAAELSAADPDNAEEYVANAVAAREEIDRLDVEVNATLASVRGASFIVFHDAFQYFERAFDFPSSGAIALSDASEPSPARIAEIQARIREQGIDCIFAEPQFNPGIVATVLEGTEAHTGVIDPLGSSLEPGADLYPQLIMNMAQALAACR